MSPSAKTVFNTLYTVIKHYDLPVFDRFPSSSTIPKTDFSGRPSAPSNLNQWTQQAHHPPPAAATRPCHGSLLAAPTPLPSSDLSIDPGLLVGDVSPFLDLLPLDCSFDGQAFDDTTWDFSNGNDNNNVPVIDEGLFDNIMIPDLNALDTQLLDVGDGFLTPEQPLNLNSTPIEQPSTTSASSTPHPTTNTTTTTNKSPIPGTSTFSLHPSPSSSSGSSLKRKSSPEDEDANVTLKRQRNTLAARKYRQKRLDRISELEAALAAMTNERDDIRLQLARREAEVDALREMLDKKK